MGIRRYYFPRLESKVCLRKECQSSSIVTSLLCDLLTSGILKSIHTFHWISREKAKSSELGEKAWIQLCTAFRSASCSFLTDLRIPNNNVGERGCNELSRLLFDYCIRKIHVLDISGNHIGNHGFFTIIRALHNSNLLPDIQELDLSNNGISIKGVKMVYQNLKQSSFQSLHILRIGCNSPNFFSL